MKDTFILSLIATFCSTALYFSFMSTFVNSAYYFCDSNGVCGYTYDMVTHVLMSSVSIIYFICLIIFLYNE